MKQVTRGHNNVADGWAGASNPLANPNPPYTLKRTQKVFNNTSFPTFRLMLMDGPTEGRTKPLIELRVRN